MINPVLIVNYSEISRVSNHVNNYQNEIYVVPWLKPKGMNEGLYRSLQEGQRVLCPGG